MLAGHEVLTYLARHEYLVTFQTITFGPQNIIEPVLSTTSICPVQQAYRKLATKVCF